MPGYGTVAPPQETHEWERCATPMSLLMSVGIAAGKNLVALLLLFWQLFKQRTFLMNCDKRIVGNWTYLCEYTKTFIRCFPLLGAIVVLCIASRQLLQQRMYYGLLKRGALLDFSNSKAWNDPLFFMLVISFLHGIGHFTLDLFVQDGYSAVDLYPGHNPKKNELHAEMSGMLKHFILPSVVFFAFLVSSYDLETHLLSLSRYFEENPAHARTTVARMPFLNEGRVQQVISTLSLKTSQEKTTLDAVYLEIIEKTPELPSQAKPGIKWHLFSTLWPAKILLDPKLTCAESRQFRFVMIFTSALTSLVIVSVFVYFSYQVYQDCFDVYEGQYEDSVSLAVLLLHAAFAGWMSLIKFRIIKEIVTG